MISGHLAKSSKKISTVSRCVYVCGFVDLDYVN